MNNFFVDSSLSKVIRENFEISVLDMDNFSVAVISEKHLLLDDVTSRNEITFRLITSIPMSPR